MSANMGWYQFYKLLEKYDGNLKKATKAEMKDAVDGNPNDPFTAREIAEKKYKVERLRIKTKSSPDKKQI